LEILSKIRTRKPWPVLGNLDPYSGTCTVPYKSPILGQLLDLISLAKINLFESRFKSYDPWVMANCLQWFYPRILNFRMFYCQKTKYEVYFLVSRTRETEYINEYGSTSKFLCTGPGSEYGSKFSSTDQI
jgi:hypothetical protein